MLNYFNKRIFILFIFPIILGGVSVFSFQPFNFLFINFLSLPVLLFLIIYVKKKSKSTYRKKPFLKNLFYLGTSYGFSFYFFNLHWIVNSMTFDETFKIFIPFGLILIPLFLSLFFSIPIILSGFFLNEKISSILIISFLFAISDFIRSKILTGFPWNIWIYSYSSNLESLQLLDKMGFFSLNLIVITFFFLPTIFFLKVPKKFLLISFFSIIFLSNYFYGSYKINSYFNEKKTKKIINFKIISPSLELSQFKDPYEVLKTLIKISDPQKNKETIFIWPEGVFMGDNFSNIKNIEKVRKLFEKKFSKNHFVVLGANTENKGSYFNSFLIVDSKLNIISQYDKKKLVPFGEFLPFEKILNKVGLKKITPGYTSFSKGEKKQLIGLKYKSDLISILPLICYEIIFPNIIEKDSNEFDFIINISEDAWFGTSIGPHQHFSKAILRSIESRKFVIRSANKGISAFLDPTGKVVKSLEPSEPGNIELEVPVHDKLEIQHKKSLIFLLLLITYVLTIFIIRKFKF